MKLLSRLGEITVSDLVTLRWRKKPLSEQPDVEYMGYDVVWKKMNELPASTQRVEQLASTVETPDDLRRLKELEAKRAEQPFEWPSHVYVTVSGELRWRCCLNLFTDDHSPWCASPGGKA